MYNVVCKIDKYTHYRAQFGGGIRKMSIPMNKQRFAMLAIMLILMSTMLGTVSLAKGSGIFSDFNVTIDKSGNASITGENDSAGAWSKLIEKYKGFIVGVSAVGAVTMVVLFIIQFMKLGSAAGNPQQRSQALTGVLWTGLAAAGLGAVSLIVGIFYNAI